MGCHALDFKGGIAFACNNERCWCGNSPEFLCDGQLLTGAAVVRDGVTVWEGTRPCDEPLCRECAVSQMAPDTHLCFSCEASRVGAIEAKAEAEAKAARALKRFQSKWSALREKGQTIRKMGHLVYSSRHGGP